MIYRFAEKEPSIHPTAFVHETSIVVGDVTIGPHCYVGYGAILRGDYGHIVIGEGTAVEEGVVIHSAPGCTATIGNRVTMGHGAIVHAERLDDYCVIGMGAVVSIGAQVGTWSIVAEGAVVPERSCIPDHVLVGGVPAKILRPIEERHMQRWEEAKQVYVDLAATCNTPGTLVRIDA